MKATFVTLLITVFLSSNALAHRMNKPGPNNGYIRMPGTYHIELVAQKNVIKLFFLDTGFKPLPTTKATVKMALKGLNEVPVSCVKEIAFFVCDMKDANMNKYSEIDVKTSKAGEKEISSIYRIPLSF
ncbi:MAG: hypothetical protein H7336_06590 [Bacteriovorax sp.]|nr:hypothetical protein [Bacteriovorax sp.]